jgi:GT2 family glycosyltransferase
MSKRVIEVYRRVKKSNVWHENRFASLVYPVAKVGVKGLIRVRLAGRWVLQRGRWVRHHTRRAIAKRHRGGDFRLHRARRAVQQKNWLLAKNRYKLILEGAQPAKLGMQIEARANTSLIDRILDIHGYKKHIDAYNKAKKRPRVAVYTAISGGYDTLKLPQILNPAFDYILFTETPTRGSGIFQIRPLPFFHQETTRRARFVKTHPHHLLEGYDYAIWIDANIMTVEDITPLFEDFVRSKKAIGAIRHPLRNSIHEEAEECISRGKDEAELIKQQMAHYKKLKFDSKELVESGFMMFDLKSERLDNFFATWWAEIDAYSRRDQLSLPYALHKSKVAWHKLTEPDIDVRNHSSFTIVPHKADQSVVLELERLLGSKKTSPISGPSFYARKRTLLANELLDKKRIDIIYCVHNALEDVKICLESVEKHHTKNERLIIIDDGSDEDTKVFLEGFAKKHKQWARVIRSQSASGYTKAANRGLRASTGDLMILLNSDTIVTSNWTRKMALAVYTTPGAGIVGPLSSAAGHQSIPDNETIIKGQTAINSLPPGATPEDMNRYCERWSNASATTLFPLMHGFCYGIRREVIDKLGYFDEKNFPVGYGEENDYSFRATDAGFHQVLATNTYIFHAKSRTFKNDARRTQLMRRGNTSLRRLWSEQRIRRAVLSMRDNPLLKEMRQKAKALYK